MFLFVLLVVGGLAGYSYLRYKQTVAEGQSPTSSVVTEVGEKVSQFGNLISAQAGQLLVSQESVKQIAHAIAFAEGFYPTNPLANPSSRPTRNHNPGDLKGNYAHTAIDVDPQGFDIYANDNDGWQALYRQVKLWLTNKSAVAGDQSSIYDLSRLYTTTEQDAWANNVAKFLGVDTSTQLGDL